MKTVQRTGILITCILLYAWVSVFSQSNVVQERVTIKSIVGKAEVRSPKTGKWRPARVGMVVKMKWDVRTYVESSLEIQFASGTVIKLGENSVVNLSSLLQDKGSSATNSNVKVASGQIWANVKKLVNKKSKFTFETPTAVAAIRGTRLGIKVDKKRSVIDVYEGKVSVKNKGSRREVMISTRNRAVVESGQSGVKTLTFDEVKSETDTTKGMPAIEDIYAADTTTGIDTTEIDTTAETDTTTVETDSMVIDTTTGTDTTKTDTTAEVDEIETDTTTEVDDTTTEVEVYLVIESPEDNSVVTSPVTVIKGKATPKAAIYAGAKQTIASASGTFAITVDLLPGNNDITVTAQLGNSSKQEQVSILFEPPKSLFLSVTKPADGLKIIAPLIQVQGITLPGAQVTVNDNDVSVGQDGSFNFQIHIPDEADEYTVTVVSSYRGEEKTITVTVKYEPEVEELELVISSPKEGQVIASNVIRIVGKAVFKAKLEITGGGGNATRTFNVGNSDGSFTCDLPLTERDIGEYPIEISASNDAGDDIDKTVTVEVDIKSPSINVSSPELTIIGQLTGGTKTGYLTVQVLDRTPEDQITLTADINGSKDQYVLEPSDQEKIDLDDGKNKYAFSVTDLAGNTYSSSSGEVYYLPGPLTVDIIEPDASQYVIDDLPPMPSGTGSLSMDIEVEIEDGIADVPETILYCRVNGATLKETSNYIYEGKLALNRGVNNFLLEAEDIAGNKVKKTFTITINE